MGTRAKSEKWTVNEDWLAFWTTIGLDDPFHDVRTTRNLLLQNETEATSATTLAESPDYEAKGEKLSGEEKRVSSWMMALKLFRVPLIASVIFLVGVSWWIFSRGFQEATKVEKPESRVAATGDLWKQSVSMTKVEAVLGKGVVEVPLDLVKRHKLVSFEYKRMDGSIPLLAYVTPSGKIFTAVGLSEPCNSRSFHLEGNEIVCNLCFTRWDLETLKGTSGECADHSMDILTHGVNKGRLILKETDIQNWEPRVVRG